MPSGATRQRTFAALDRALWNAHRVDSFHPEKDRFVVFSDIHKGDGKTKSDDFVHNKTLYCYALLHYFDEGYSLVLNGDCEDCWETEPADIVRAYRDTAFAAERRFNENGRYFRIVGNHDDDWNDPVKAERFLSDALGDVRVWPALLLGGRILILHGHQGDSFDDRAGRRSRWIVRNIWAPMQRWGLADRLEPVLRRFGFVEIGRAAQNNFIRRERDRLLYDWAKKKGLLLIAGHTHRGMFRSFSKIDQVRAAKKELEKRVQNAASERERLLLFTGIGYIDKVIRESKEELKKDKVRNRLEENPAPCYFNDGCCVHTNGITGIEIDRGEIRLVKWEVSDTYYDSEKDVMRDPEFFATIQRRIYQSGRLTDILSQIGTRTIRKPKGREFGK
jgi:UDP-2,3-diacylglucosamine pyrophosphatase LpxH